MAFTHSNYQEDEVRFHPAFDYYSLGVILLDIAVWRPVDRMIVPGNTARELGLLLLEYATTYVLQRMGTGYCDVVIACLKFHDNHKHEEKESSLLLKLQHGVLKKLQQASLCLRSLQ